MSELDVVTEVWQQHAEHLLARCRRWTGNPDKAQEAFSRAWVRVLIHYPRQRTRIADVRRWLERVTYHACMDIHREARSRAEESLEDGPPALYASREPDAERSLLGRERLQFVQAAYRDLPERLHEAMGSYLHSPSYRELARHLGITESNARKRIQEARAILRRRLEDYEHDRVRHGRRLRRSQPPLPSPLHSAAVRLVTRSLCGGGTECVPVALTAAANGGDVRRRETLQVYVARHPAGWKRQLDLARVLIEVDLPEEAALHYRTAAARKPSRADIWIDAMSVYAALGHATDATLLCELAADATMHDAERALLRGLAACASGSVERARAAFEDARRLDPRAPRPCVELAKLALDEGATRDALTLLDEALALDPRDVAALTTGLPALCASGRRPEALERAHRALAVHPVSAVTVAAWLNGD